MKVKLTVMLPEADIAALKEMAERQDKTVTQVLRDAIATQKFLEKELGSGARLVLQKDGESARIVFR